MSEYRFETKQLHVGQEQADPASDARAVPIYATTSYVFHNSQHAADRFGLADAGNIYGRLTNSTQGVFEERIAALEGGVAGLALASGAAAITYTIQALAKQGEHIVAQKTIYGGSANLLAHTLPLYGIDTTFVDIHNLEEVTAAIQPNTKAIYIETLGNPNSDIPDIDALAEIAHTHGLPLVIDNTFGTPYLIRPIEHGADIVVHSATKFIGGHGTTLGGVIVDGGTFDWAASGRYPWISEPNPSYHGVKFTDAAGKAAFAVYIRAILLRDTGSCISPFAAFLLLQGTETLSLRLERHAENTKKVIKYLKNHPLVENVYHPSLHGHPDHKLYKKYFPNGGGSIFTFDIKGGKEEAFRFIDGLKIFSLLANVADVKSLVIHPATTTHSQLTDEELEAAGIHQNTIRLSIGTEHIDDIIADLENGFKAV
ncbi:O-acetylhomoserine aminocarboxypropyltransferase/cysteine synthase family protein [Ruminococcus sp.]|uniref:O-acetylhomoserine aminocarboxypropyltransferase/cysteine synthase family protein n=1 Tax=Ruminococcus sp. TaxID=41978 RepID=UPI00386FDA75